MQPLQLPGSWTRLSLCVLPQARSPWAGLHTLHSSAYRQCDLAVGGGRPERPWGLCQVPGSEDVVSLFGQSLESV